MAKKNILTIALIAVIGLSSAFASGGGERGSPSSPNAATGSDFNWRAVQGRITDYMESVAFGNGKFVAVGRRSDESTTMAYSTDGVTWTALTDSASHGLYIGSITFCGGKFFAFGWNFATRRQNTISSTDGVTWARIENNFVNQDVNGIAYGDGKFVMVSYGGSIAYSTDGVTWTAVANAPRFQYTSIAYGGGKFFATAMGGNIAYSTDGVTWTIGKRDAQVENVYYGNGMFVASESGRDGIIYSTDAITWTRVSLREKPQNIIYASDKFVAVSHGRMMAYSTDCVTWTEVSMEYIFGYDCALYGIAYGNGRFVVVGSAYWPDGRTHSDGRIAYSNKLE